MRRWLAMLLLLSLPLIVRADQTILGGGTRWNKGGRDRVGPEKCATADTRQDGHGDGTTAYFSDAFPTCPISCGGTGAWCVKEAGVWNCCHGTGGASCQQINCPVGQVQAGTNSDCTPICEDAPCGDAESCPPGSVLIGFDSGCAIICEPLCQVCSDAGIDSCSCTTTTAPTTTTTESTTTTTTTSTTTTTTMGPSTTFLFVPLDPTNGVPQNSPGGANVLQCDAWVPAIGIVNVDRLSFEVLGSSGSPHEGVAIYNKDGSSRIVSTGGVATAGGVNSVTGLSFTITAGTEYQVCHCSDTTGVGLSVMVTPSDVSGAISAIGNQLANPGSSAATNACTAASPPATTGTLNTDVHVGMIELLLSTTTP